MAKPARYAKSLAPVLLACLALTMPNAQPKPGSTSVSIQIQAVVPPILNLSLDFAPHSTAQLRGWLSPREARAETLARFGATKPSEFSIQEGAVVELGGIHVFSNTNAPASIQIHSANGGCLQSESVEKPVSIPYFLVIEGQRSLGSAGSFSIRSPGKTPMEGRDLRLALAIASVPPAASSGWYSDTLTFQIAAN
ncbi:MAG TPA: hypothetical protein VIO60_01930 [Rectinemataceae bacterium]